LHYRYFWTPEALILPLYNVQASDMAWQSYADNLSSLEEARKVRERAETPDAGAQDTHKAKS